MENLLILEGHLKIWKNGDLIVDGKNIILDNYRVNLANLMVNCFEGGNAENNLDDLSGFYEKKNENANTFIDSIIPYGVAFDHEGAVLNDGVWDVSVPETDEFVGKDGDDYFMGFIDDVIEHDLGRNAIKVSGTMSEHQVTSNTKFSRATLFSRDGQPLATKCFPGNVISENDNFYVEWSIAY